jgi:membrane protein implicated in regulation of membrane protease activity
VTDNHLDPEGAALYAIIAICLVVLGALLTTGIATTEQRGAVLAGIVTVLLAVAYRWRRRHREDKDE